MKKLITILCVALIATFSGKNLMAANFSALEGTNYHIIWLDADTDDEFEISKKLIKIYVSTGIMLQIQTEKKLFTFGKTLMHQ